jgi:glycosyltransferase involved in cell wall biosynthesis
MEEEVKADNASTESAHATGSSPDHNATPIARPRIAIASSGLGHIRRGVESWAEDLASALHRSGADVTLFQGGGSPSEPWRRALPCLRRFEPLNTRLLAFTRHLGGWRYGLGSPYSIEQTSFSLALWRATRSTYDILHVQDPTVAAWMDRLNRLGLYRPRVILGNGTEESDAYLHKFSYLQHLTPGYRDDYESHRPAKQLSFGIPNFIDIQRFHPPANAAARASARAAFGLHPSSLIILSVAALKRHHKRCDYLIQEFAQLRSRLAPNATLVIAGGREAETPEVIALGKSLLGDSVIFFESIDRDRLITLYQAADIFALASLHEMMPVSLLEALASGLPAACNDTPTLRWVVGPAGHPEDISQPGGLVRQWSRLIDPAARLALSSSARAHVESTFAEPIVIKQITDMYDAVLQA